MYFTQLFTLISQTGIKQFPGLDMCTFKRTVRLLRTVL